MSFQYTRLTGRLRYVQNWYKYYGEDKSKSTYERHNFGKSVLQQEYLNETTGEVEWVTVPTEFVEVKSHGD